ncbi:MAG TPA: hypothetical protein VGM92_14665 [Candidatus Kapabacteria bacterium]|jgi:hypothetical protein
MNITSEKRTSMKLDRVITVLFLCSILFVLFQNARSLYTYPVPNSWIYWSGDETQAMSESVAQVKSGIYSYPLAVGSIFSQGSGIVKGSVWISSLLYGGAGMIGANLVDAGRTASFVVAIFVLAAIYFIARRYGVRRNVALFGVLAFAATPCFLIMSHCARYDIFVGFSCLLLIAFLIPPNGTNISRTVPPSGVAIGLVLIAGLMVSAHVWIDCFLAVLFLMWRRKIWRKPKSLLQMVLTTACGLALLSLVYYLGAGRFDLLGPFDHVPLPLYRFFSPGAERGNLLYRWFIVRQWSPAYIGIGMMLLVGIIYFLIKKKHFSSVVIEWAGAVGLILFSIVYLEMIVPRYYIYVLPAITVLIALVADQLWTNIERNSLRWAIGTLIVAFLGAQTVLFMRNADEEAMYSAKLVLNNSNALHSVKEILEKDSASRIRVVGYPAALYVMEKWPRIQTIVPLFLDAPSAAWVRDRSPNGSRADYLVSYNSSRVLDPTQNDRLVLDWLDGHAIKVFESVGCYTDIGRSYSADGMKGFDTLRLYRMHP